MTVKILFRSYGKMPMLILAKLLNSLKKMNKAIQSDIGVPCLTSLVPIIFGRMILQKDFILPV